MDEINATSDTNSVLATTLLTDLEISSTGASTIYNDTAEMYIELPNRNDIDQEPWNSSKTNMTTSLPETLSTQFNTSKTTVYMSTTALNPFDEFGPPEGIEYIFVPLGVVVFVIILSAVVLIVSRKRKLERLRHKLMPMYNFDPGEEEEDDWETELLDECCGNHQRRQGYQTMDAEENAELFSNH